jgi:hypothetical protein
MTPAAILATIILAVAPVPVEHAPCPQQAAIEYAGCYYPPPTDLIYVPTIQDPSTQDEIMWHERGHAADWHFLTAGERHRFTCLPALRTTEERSRCGHPWGPVMIEMWADAYATCHFRNLPSRGISPWVGDLRYWPKTDRRQVNACRFIARAVAS